MMSIVQPGHSGPSWWSSLCKAVKHGDKPKVEDLVKKHYKPVENNPTADNVLSESPLHLAILHGKDDIFELLLSHKFDIGVTNLYGETPLHVACRTGNIAMVQCLLRSGSCIDYKDCGECTPLFHAIYSHQQAVAELLIKEGCDLDTLNEELMSPLDHAVFYNDKEIITLLLQGGCAIDKTMGMVYYPGHYSNSILFSLWANSDTANVKTLIDSGYQIPYSQLIKLLQVAQQLEWDDSLLKAVGEMIREPISLKGCARIAVRRHLMNIKNIKRKSLQSLVKMLPLPNILKIYIGMMQ